MFKQHQMSYRRDAKPDESIPLPIETVYNSVTDAITTKDEDGDKDYFRNGIEHFNRIYFNYPPEWRTSDVGEKIIGVRNMRINIRQCMQLEFVLYIRKYKRDKFNELAKGLEYKIDDMTDEQIQDIVNRMEREDCKVFKVYYCNDIFDNVNDFIEDLNDAIDNVNIYDKLYRDVLKSAQSNDNKIAALDQLNEDMDDHTIICLRNHIPFHLDRENDIDIYENIGNETRLTITSCANDEYYFDFMMTADNNDATYKKFYMWDDDNDEPLPYAAVNPGELDLNIYDDDTVNDRFEFDTACYFHIGVNNPYRNSIHHITKFHRELEFKHILTNLQCEVAASFASQSNHNLIGRTNEAYTPIKYYKLNDNDDKFWIELYDRNEIDIPVAFEDFFVFTMDVVLLQNRKLIYS